MLRTINRWLVGLLLGLTILISTGFGNEDFFSSGAETFVFDDYLIDNLPGAYFYTSFIENYAPDITLMIEESSGFALIDNPRVYFEGDSYIQANWHYNGVKINSALNPGSPALLLPFSALSHYRLQGETPLGPGNGLHFVSRLPEQSLSRLALSTVYTDMGSYTPWLTFMVEGHASTRDDRLYTTRRKTLANYFIDWLWCKTFKKAGLMVALNYFDIERQFNDFNRLDTTYEESGKLFLAKTSYRKHLNRGSLEFFGIFNHLERTHLDAELGSLPEETAGKERYAVLAGMTLEKPGIDFKLSIQYEKENIEPNVWNFSREMMDNDGDRFFPESRVGDFSAAVVNADLAVPLTFKKVHIRPFLDVRHSVVQGREEAHDHNGLLFGGTHYQVVVWERGQDYSHTNTHLQAGLDFSVDFSAKFSAYARLFLLYSRLGFENVDNNLTFFTPGFDLGLHLLKSKKTTILLAYGQIPYDIREDVNAFLESSRPYGTIYGWNDGDGDAVFQPGEETGVFGYTGAAYHHLAENVSAPIKQRLMLTLSTRISKRWVFQLKGIIKKIRNNLAVRFDQDWGFYETHGDYDIYFFDQPFKDYYLTNYDYRKDPFYAQLLLHFKGGKKDRWFFSFSFLAHLGMGVTAFGNGAAANDIGILHESMANPNSWINGFGRVDGDRAFVAKLYYGFHITRRLFLGISLKYRDGTPFAFINSLYAHNQWVLYYATIKAEDEKGVKGGPREDYVGDLSLRLNYKFRLFGSDALLSLSIFNILDLGHELSEYVFSGGSRDAMELNIPKSLRLTLSMRF